MLSNLPYLNVQPYLRWKGLPVSSATTVRSPSYVRFSQLPLFAVCPPCSMLDLKYYSERHLNNPEGFAVGSIKANKVHLAPRNCLCLVACPDKDKSKDG
jgi:hypothetical protein